MQFDRKEQFAPTVTVFGYGQSSIDSHQGLVHRQAQVFDTYDEALEYGLQQAEAYVVLGATSVEVVVNKRVLVKAEEVS